ncbi:MAG: sulfatase-like hydrolase/transferase [Campylobacter sp.]|nr:sulfatase-like hydrolase/transferase [Campylobacter sp.]
MKSGIKAYWFDNNSGGCKGVCDRVPLQNQKDYRAKGYDENIFNDAKNLLANLDESALIILHLQGTHGSTYYENYPNSFRKFSPTCDSAELQNCQNSAIANTYDNVIFYQDYLPSQIIESLKNKDGFESVMFFVSDHGESLGENGLYLHGMPYALAPDFQKHIPALIWTNSPKKRGSKISSKYATFTR